MSPGISFGPRVEWGAYSQPGMLLLARTQEVKPLAVRVLFAAMGRHDINGHAPFRPRELADILRTVDMETGEVRSAQSDTVSDALRQAKEVGYVLPESTARCVVLAPHMFQKGKGAPLHCVHH